jgi:hypothetical protein
MALAPKKHGCVRAIDHIGRDQTALWRSEFMGASVPELDLTRPALVLRDALSNLSGREVR